MLLAPRPDLVSEPNLAVRRLLSLEEDHYYSNHSDVDATLTSVQVYMC